MKRYLSLLEMGNGVKRKRKRNLKIPLSDERKRGRGGVQGRVDGCENLCVCVCVNVSVILSMYLCEYLQYVCL